MISWQKSINFPNAISIARGILGLFLPFLILSPSRSFHWAALVLFIIGSVSDYWDGWLARRQGIVTPLGKILDPLTDKILILGILAAFAVKEFFSPWWLVPIFFREIVITFCRVGWLLEGKAIGAERLGKMKLVFQVVTVSFAFLELLVRNDVPETFWPSFFSKSLHVFLLATNFLTLWSGIAFTRSNRALFSSPHFAKFVNAAGVGLLPGPAGTWGSLFALLFVPLAAWNPWLYLGLFIFFFSVSYFTTKFLDFRQQKDPSYFVMDEVLGIWISMWGVPVTFTSLMAGFFLFRVFDIVKPFPCRRLEKVKGFWGIHLDDWMAGFYTWLILHFFYL